MEILENGRESGLTSKNFNNFIKYPFNLSRDPEWKNINEYVKEELGLAIEDDGEFYMNFDEDFLKYFGEVEIVHKTPDSMMEEEDQNGSRKYSIIRFEGAWRDETAGGCGNDTISINEFMHNIFLLSCF